MARHMFTAEHNRHMFTAEHDKTAHLSNTKKKKNLLHKYSD